MQGLPNCWYDGEPGACTGECKTEVNAADFVTFTPPPSPPCPSCMWALTENPAWCSRCGWGCNIIVNGEVKP